MSGEILNLKKAQLELLIKNSKLPILIDFWGTGCSPCKLLEPIIGDIAKEYKERIRVCKVNIIENFKIGREYDIRSIPTVILMKDGKVHKKIIGVHKKAEISELIESII